MNPTFRLVGGGADITARVKDRLLSLQFQDEAEDKSDVLTIRLDDRPVDGVHAEFPTPGVTLKLWLGYEQTGAVYMGSFVVTDIAYSAPPATMEIRAKAAYMPRSFRTPVDRSWHNPPYDTLGKIISTIASENGYGVKMDPKLAAVPIKHEDQSAESPMQFATRLAARHDGVVKPVNGILALVPKGEAKTAGGRSIPAYTIRPEQTSRWRYSREGRTDPTQATDVPENQEGAVQADTWNIDDAKPEVSVSGGGGVPERVRYWHADFVEAKGVSATGKNTRDRAKAKFRMTLPGDTSLMAEQKLTLSGFRPGIPTDWRVLQVQHELTEGGYVCSCRAEIFQEGQESAT